METQTEGERKKKRQRKRERTQNTRGWGDRLNIEKEKKHLGSGKSYECE